MKNITLNIILLCLVTFANAQDFNNYQTLTSKGKIPRDYITSSTVKYKGEIAKIDKLAKSKKEKKTREAFALENNFVLDDMLQSGLVIFNDDISVYLNEVMAQLTAVDNMKVHVYTLRSAAVNAFATPRGDIFVTLGLLSQLENEAQLAFILAHELTHVKKEHSIELYLTAAGVGKNSKRNEVMRNASFDTKMLTKCRYSKELETEADHDGIERFLKTKYSTQTLMQVYDVLKYAYLPFDDVPFDLSILESKDYKLPSNAILAKTAPISTEDKELDEEEEERSTHPSIPTRREHLKEVLKDLKDTLNKSNYLVSEERFKKVRQMARYELPMMYVQNKQIARSLYTTFLLLKQNPESQYLQKCMAKTLYNHAKFRNQDDYSYESHYKNVEGHSQAAHYLAEKLKAKDLTLLATRYAWMLHQKYPKDAEVTTIVNDLLAEIGKHFKSLNTFKTPNMAVKAAGVAPIVPKDSAELSKYDKIKSSKDSTTNTNDYAFAEFVKDSAFVSAFAKGHEAYKERQTRVKYYESDEGKKDYAKYEKNTKKKGLKLGISKIVIVNPFYLKLDARKDNSVQYIATEEGQVHQRALIETAAKAANLQTEVLDVTHLKESQIDVFNDIRFLNEYFSEQNKLSGLSLTPSAQQNRIDAIAKKYGTDYFLWTGTVSLREEPIPLGAVFASVLIPIWLPFAVVDYCTPNYNMMHYAVLYDVRTGRNQTIKADFFDQKDADDLMKSQLYDTFLQIKVSDDEKASKPAQKKQKVADVEEDKSEEVKTEAKEEVKEEVKEKETEKVEKAVEKEVETPKKATSTQKKQKVSASSDPKTEDKTKKKKK
jgi:beta-barrel assembly-enhancing protease